MEYPVFDFNAEKVRWYILNKLNTRKEKQDYLDHVFLDLEWVITDLETCLNISAVSKSDIENQYILREIEKVESCTYGSMFLRSLLTKLLNRLRNRKDKLITLKNCLLGGSRLKFQEDDSRSSRKIERIYINGPRVLVN